MRLLLVGAFPYPHFQGSQVYFQEQAIALRDAGAEVEMLTYADARGGELDGSAPASASTRALAGFKIYRSPDWTAPRSKRSGPSWAKPLGDVGLAQALRHLLASKVDDADHNARPSVRYDAILTHNAEAALVALAAAPRSRPPILYCVHTLMGHELSTYAKTSPKGSLEANLYSRGTPLRERVINRSGRVIDRWIARRLDGWIALTQSSARVMQQHSKGPGALIPPPVPDPMDQAQALKTSEICARHGLERDRFFLYSGNLDPYQELDILAAAAARRAESDAGEIAPLVLASHDPEVRDWTAGRKGVRACVVESAEEMQALLCAARASLVLRKAVGGFPIKLANSLSVGTPALAFHGREWGLLDRENALICDLQDPVGSIANAIAYLEKDDELALRLSRGARQLYQEQHRPEKCAAETLALIERIQRFRGDIGDPPGV